MWKKQNGKGVDNLLKHIDIYIESDIPPLKRQAGKYGYVLAYINKNNELKTAEGYGSVQSATQNSIALDAMAEALERMRETAEITIYVNSSYVAGMFASGTLEKWQQNGFFNSKNKKIVDYPKWERLSNLVRKNVVSVIYVPHHEYSLYLRNYMKKL